VRLVHRPQSSEADRVLATDLEFADSLWAKTRGLMFRRAIPEDYGLVFRFETVKSRDLHMLFVPFRIDAVWIVDNEVTAVKQLRPWIGLGRASADTIVELPAGVAEAVSPGDTLEIIDC